MADLLYCAGIMYGRKSLSETVKKVMKFVAEEECEVIDVIWTDFDKTVKMLLKKDGEEYYLPIVETVYDTDEHGEIVKYRGQIDIRDTPWFKNKLAEEQQDG